MAAHQGDGIHEGRRRLGVPSRCAMGRGSLLPQQMGRQGGPGEEPHQDRRGASDGLIRPLALGLHAQMRPHLLEGDLQLPAQHKPFQYLRRIRRRIGAEQGLGSEFALGVPNQDPTQGYRRLARAVPDRRLRGESPNVRVVPSYQAADTVAQDTVGKSRSVFSAGSRRPFSGGRPF